MAGEMPQPCCQPPGMARTRAPVGRSHIHSIRGGVSGSKAEGQGGCSSLGTQPGWLSVAPARTDPGKDPVEQPSTAS